EILKIYKDSKGRYGAPKIHKVIREEREHAISLKRVQRIMKKLNIKSIIIKKFRPHSSKSKIAAKENVLKRDFSTTTINEKWVTDITYIYTLKDGWCYLASVLDLHTNNIVHSFSGKGCPYDNACIESWYNRKRLHSSIGYMTPQQLEDVLRKTA
ncbi:IS3 family transposase, partial [Caproiciproducens sp. MSJ-32]|uniref:IS3 family transposase n=1 Tax=Caproiciproducens sp. MSJ-32 TaxID=2841527 RepID=UPI001C1141A4